MAQLGVYIWWICWSRDLPENWTVSPQTAELALSKLLRIAGEYIAGKALYTETARRLITLTCWYFAQFTATETPENRLLMNAGRMLLVRYPQRGRFEIGASLSANFISRTHHGSRSVKGVLPTAPRWIFGTRAALGVPDQ